MGEFAPGGALGNRRVLLLQLRGDADPGGVLATEKGGARACSLAALQLRRRARCCLRWRPATPLRPCRLLIGGPVGVAFVAMPKLAGHWFAPTRFAMPPALPWPAVPGAVSAGVPLRLLVYVFGWRGALRFRG
jgi:hypothetical protein